MMRYFGLTDRGLVRENNEDAYALPEALPDNEDDLFARYGHLFVLGDGVGGYAAGEVASRMVCDTILQEYYQSDVRRLPRDILRELAFATHQEVREYGRAEPHCLGMSSTLVALLLRANRAYYLSAGDSRIYRFDHMDGLVQITPDHSEIWPLYLRGVLTKDQLRSHPRNHIITSGIGLSREIEVFQTDEPIRHHAIYLLCSDGLTDLVSDAEITAELARPSDLAQKARHLLQKACHYGARDNVTIVLVSDE
jgi:protein phosphatase